MKVFQGILIGNSNSFSVLIHFNAISDFSCQSLLWQYRFSFLRGSSDDGFRKIVLLFSASPAGPFDRQVSYFIAITY